MDYQIVWFTQALAEKAMMLLYLPPEMEFREKRGKLHPFRMWLNVNMPIPGGIGIKCHCVAVDRPGSIRLRPGGQKDRRCVVADFCTGVVEIEPGLMAGYVKDETWLRPDFVAAAEADTKREEKAVLRREQDRKTIIARKQAQRSQALRRYFLAICAQRQQSWRTPLTALQDVYMIQKIEDEIERPCDIEEWLAVVAPETAPQENKLYDPRTFPVEAMKVFAMAGEHSFESGNAFEAAQATKARSMNLVG